jgi:SAM-dependent methyltransferase
MSVEPSLEELSSQWKADLQSWAIPPEILAQAEQPPWGHPVAMFTVTGEVPDSISHQRAREALPVNGSVLDVGSGGGRASMAITPPASMLVAVDHQQEMLVEFSSAAIARGATAHTYLGAWPEIADQVPEVDVVVCHHVAYNVQDIVPFLIALNDHAKKRVVLELPMTHPMSNMNALWKKFWDLDRPTEPTPYQLQAIAREIGYQAELEVWTDETWGKRVDLPQSERVRQSRIRLCLTEDRDAEVAAALLAEQDAKPRQVATLWWDVTRHTGMEA